MNEVEARRAEQLRDMAYMALTRGDMQEAKEAIQALMPFDRKESLRLLTSLGIETNDAEAAESALRDLKKVARQDPYTGYLSARIDYMKGKRASIVGPLENLLRKNMSAQIRERVCNLLGRICRQLGESKKAAHYDLEASKLAAPGLASNEYGNYLFDLHHIADIPQEEQRKEAARFDDFFSNVDRFFHRRRTSEQPLRIGYISSDFRYHVVLRFVAAMLWGHGKTPFSVYAYMTGNEDAFSRELSGRVDVWRNLSGLSPEKAARLIYDDEIDILIELGGHTVGNSLKILAYKPAPIQISGIGYWASTGLSAIDYFLGDIYLDDEDTQKAFTEQLLILPHTHFCYTEVGDIPMPADEPPCIRNGFVTFGSFNDFGKLSDETLRLWAQIMNRIPDSRLLLKGNIFSDPENRQYALRRLEKMGIASGRIETRKFTVDYLNEYADMDIALDTFPYPGGGTTCDAIFMGVPVVTLAGKDHGGRFGKSLLFNLGLNELVAYTSEEYVSKAVGLAGDRELLSVFRKNLRIMMRNSPLMDGEQYRKDLTAAYMQVWNTYIRTQWMPNKADIPMLADRMENLFEEGDRHQALAVAESVWAAVPEDLEIVLRLAAMAIKLEASSLAGEVTKWLRSEIPEDGYVSYLAAASARLSGDMPEAYRLTNDALLDPQMTHENKGAVFYLKGGLQQEDKKYGEAADMYLSATKYFGAAEQKAEAYSRYLLCMYLNNQDASILTKASKEYGAFFDHVSPYVHDPSADHHDMLRIGYLLHGIEDVDDVPFFQVLFQYFDRRRFRVYGYVVDREPDRFHLIAQFATAWTDLSDLSYEAAARSIHQDEIDILVDLTGHSQGNALPILAYKPAPVQLSGIGYPVTTGLSAVDYFVTDKHAAEKEAESYYTEKLLRLPESQFCFAIPRNASRYAVHAPVCDRGYITFGVFAEWGKVTDEALRTWADILHRVDESRLLVRDDVFSEEPASSNALERMKAAGIDTDRVDVAAHRDNHFLAYEQVDVLLDTFPRTGKRALIEALYMGIPVVVKKGNSPSERVGASILANVELNSLCAPNLEVYAETAVRLAKDTDNLSELHLTLRRRLLRSAVMEPQRYMDALEEAYGRIFAEWEETAANKKALKENIERRWKRFQKAREENNLAEAVAPGGRLAAANVNISETFLQMADAYYNLADTAHCLYWTRGAELTNPSGRASLLAWLGWAQESRALPLTSVTTRREMLYTLSSKKSMQYLCHVVRMQLASLLFRLGEMEAARKLYIEASARAEGSMFECATAYGSSLLSYNGLDISGEDLLKKSMKYSEFYRDIVPFQHDHNRNHKGKIRIGYISSDFRLHVMFHFYWAFFAFRNRNRFELYVYNRGGKNSDMYTEILKQQTDGWRDVEKKPYDEVAKIIYDDNVDILFDLSGHTAGGGIPAFAYKPAPIQICGLGYMATTGLNTIDYFLTDGFVDPPGTHENCFVEKLLYVTTQFCYAVMGKDQYPASMGAPCKKRGWILFGVFNHYRKLTDEMLLVWKKILFRVPGSKILFKGDLLGSMELQEAAYQRFKALGYPMDRVLFEGATEDYMQRYLDDVDIALDTYPWPGGGTTCDALYMGVPVVSRYGERRSTRFSYGILHTVGLGELAAATTEEYIEKAVALASDTDFLDILHKNLRPMMEKSPLMDATLYIKEVEAHYENIWKHWQDGGE